MDTLRIRGLKSLLDTGDIPLKPLTILLGENSSGKSSFLRSFPLLKQSTIVATKGPILWYGPLVDFGNFENSLSSFNESDEISFTYRANIPEPELRTRFGYHRSMIKRLCGEYSFGISVKNSRPRKNEVQRSTYTSNVSIQKGELKSEIVFSEKNEIKSFKINGNEYIDLVKNLKAKNSPTNGVIPEIYYSHDENEIYSIWSIYRYGIEPDKASIEAIDSLKSILKRYSHSRSNVDRTILKALEIFNHTGESLEKISSIMSTIDRTKTWKKKISTLIESDTEEIRNLIFIIHTPILLDLINGYLTKTLQTSTYLAPLRATAERYYRVQDLAVDEVDHQGKNLALFISNLSDKQRESYKKWLKDNFGFYVFIPNESGHLSLKISFNENQSHVYNITDMGFGFSQILPIVTQLWFSTIDNQQKTSLNKIVVIEQPELHLHPRFQAKFIDSLCKIIKLSKESGSEIKILIETHSETIINRTGKLIEGRHLDSDDVSISIFEKTSIEKETSVQITGFDEEGNLKNWPWGFFEAGEYQG